MAIRDFKQMVSERRRFPCADFPDLDPYEVIMLEEDDD